MVGIGAEGFIVRERRTLGKIAPQKARAGFAVVEKRALENRLPFHVERKLWQALGAVEFVIDLLPAHERERVVFIPFGDRQQAVRVRVQPKLPLVEVLQVTLVA